MNKSMYVALLATAALPGVARAQTAPSDFTAATRYDLMHRVTGTIAPDPDGSGPLHYAAVRNTYDAVGRLVRVETGELSAWQSEAVAPSAWTGFSVFRQVDTSYDILDRKLVDRVSSGGTTYTATQYSYEPGGQLECTAVRMNLAAMVSLPASACTLGAEGSGVNAAGPDRITKNLYDDAGELVQVRKAVGTSLEQAYVTYGYTPNGKRSDVIDANGDHALQAYDGMDRKMQWNFPSATAPTGYDGSTPSSALSTAGSVNTLDVELYGYDAVGNLTLWRKRDGRTFTMNYDALNRVSSRIVPDGCASIQQGACPAAAATRDIYYSYDARGLQTAARFDSATGGDAVLSGYDGFGRQTSTTTSMGGISRTLTFQFDADGDRTSIKNPDNQAFAYEYDGLDRNTLVRDPATTIVSTISYNAQGLRGTLARSSPTTAYGYEAIQRLSSLGHALQVPVTTTFAYNPAGQVTSEGRDNDAYAYNGGYNQNQSYAINGLNQYTAVGGVALAYDANGNLITNGAASYGYDSENRLVTSSGGATLTYDPTGRLWQTTGGSGTTQFVYDGDQLTAEYDGSGALLRRYVHGTAEDDPLLWYEGSTLGDRRALMTDHQGSVVSVARPDGSAVAIDTYDEYGNPALANQGRFQYTGQAWLPDLGLYYYKARTYSPKLGRFLQTDPVGYDDQFNLYAYVANDPVNKTDPSGQAGQDGLEMRVRQDEQDLLAHRITEQEFRDRQQARGVGGLIGAGLATAVVAAPEIATGIAARAGFVATRGALAAAENGGEVALQRTAQGAATTIRNIITNNGTASDFLGAARESRGVQTGFDHVTEMRNSIRGLEGASRSLGGSLRNPNLSSELRGALQGWKNAADTAIKQMRKMLD